MAKNNTDKFRKQKCPGRRNGRKCKANMEYLSVEPLATNPMTMIEDWHCPKCNTVHRCFTHWVVSAERTEV